MILEGKITNYSSLIHSIWFIFFLLSSRCQTVIERAFDSWNDREHKRRFRQTKLLLDLPPDYEPVKATRSITNSKRKQASVSSLQINKKPKNPKANAIKCGLLYLFSNYQKLLFFLLGANGCNSEISSNDPTQNEAIQCCHQNDKFNYVDSSENCFRWLCNRCRIKLGISTDHV